MYYFFFVTGKTKTNLSMRIFKLSSYTLVLVVIKSRPQDSFALNTLDGKDMQTNCISYSWKIIVK